MVGTALARLCPPYEARADRRIILRRFGAFVHAVVAHHFEHPKMLDRRIRKQAPAEFDAGLLVRQIDQMRKVAVAIDTGETVVRPLGFRRQRGVLRFRREEIGRLAPCGVVVRRAPLGLPGRLARPFFVNDLGDANPVIRKHPLAADGLDIMMVRMGAPRRQGPLVLPDLVRQQQVLPRQAPEAIDEAAAADRLEVRLQRRREIKILIAVAGLCLNFKEQANHRNSSDIPRCGS